MPFARPRDVTLHYQFSPGTGRAVVFCNSLGTDLRLWDLVRAALPDGVPVLAIDKRGHGLSSGLSDRIASLATDVADIADWLGLSDALVCGVSVGGQIALELASARPDLVRGVILSNTAHRIGTPELWASRMGEVEQGGLPAISDAVMTRWFSPEWRRSNPVDLEGWRTAFERGHAQGYLAVCAALRDADLEAQARSLRCPTTCIAGQEDGATPPHVVRGLAEIIPGAQLVELEGVGHLPAIEVPERMAQIILEMRDELA